MRITQFVVGAIVGLSCGRALADPAGSGVVNHGPPSAAPGKIQAAVPLGAPAPSEGQDSCQTDAEVARQVDALFEKAKAAYDANDKELSAFLISRAYEVSKCKEFLFIIAELHREQGHSCEAYQLYQKYVQELPNGRNAIGARQLAEELADSCKPSPTVTSEQPVEPKPLTPPPVQPSTSPPGHQGSAASSSTRSSAWVWTPSRVVGWASIGAGVITGAVAAYYVGVEKHAENDIEALWDSHLAGNTSSEAWQANSSSLESKGLRAERTAQILGVSAGALVVGGALLVILGHNSERPTNAAGAAERLNVQLGPRAMHANYTVHF